MTLPRMTPSDGVAWVTGASSGIGAAVALELARRGWTVAATARRLDRLEALARESEGLAGRIVAHVGDVTDAVSTAALVAGIEHVHGAIALAFLNAGVAPARKGALDLAALRQALEVNVLGVAAGIAALLEPMGARRRGQIAINGSLAGYRGIPKAAAYGASKAAVIHLAEALKFDCDALGIRLQIVNPGFVDTDITRTRRFAMPMLMPADEAARRIVDGFGRGGFEIAFPRRLAFAMGLLRRLPYPVSFALLSRLAARGGRRD